MNEDRDTVLCVATIQDVADVASDRGLGRRAYPASSVATVHAVSDRAKFAMDWISSYLALAAGLAFAWIVFLAWYVRQISQAKQKETSLWWGYVLFWPWLFSRMRRDLQRNGRVFTRREFMMALALFFIMIGAIVIEKMFPVSSRTFTP